MKHDLSISNTGCTEIEISKFEEEIGFKLPKEYKDFVRNANGGKPSSRNCLYLYRSFVRPSKTSTGSIGRWLSINGHLGIIECMRNMGGMLPTGYIPIAELASGDPLVLCLHTDRHGFVYQVEFDFIDEGEPPQTILAKTFHDFITSLQDMNNLETIIESGIPCNHSITPV